jgi:hypothetical protein
MRSPAAPHRASSVSAGPEVFLPSRRSGAGVRWSGGRRRAAPQPECTPLANPPHLGFNPGQACETGRLPHAAQSACFPQPALAPGAHGRPHHTRPELPPRPEVPSEELHPESKAGQRVVDLDKASVIAGSAHQTQRKRERLPGGSVWQDSGCMFTREDGSALNPDWISRRFKELSAEAGPLPAPGHARPGGQCPTEPTSSASALIIGRRS